MGMDRESIITGLNDIGSFIAGRIGYEQAKNYLHTIDEVITLLKEQKAVEPSFNERMNHFVCRNCSLVLVEGRDDYCPSCGKQIAWDEYYIHEDETEGR